MIFEYPSDGQFGYIYIKEFKDSKSITFNYINKETINNTTIFKILNKIFKKRKDTEETIENLIKKVTCKCGSKLIINQMHMMPQEGWENLIDFWSCHNSEFKTMLELKITPRKDGILLDNFYFLKNSSEMCCLKQNTHVSKIFYNQIFDKIICKKIVYMYFKNYFMHNSSYVFSIANIKYEIKIFSYVIVEKDGISYCGMKIGYKKIRNKEETNKIINEYFRSLIYELILENNFSVYVLGYNLSYILKENIVL